MKKISTVGVVGAGTMGAALAQKFAQEGFSVVLLDRSEQLVIKGLVAIEKTLNEGVERRVFSAEEAEVVLTRIRGSERMEDLSACDLVVEAIFEDVQAKSELFRQVSAVVKPEAIIATNTSSFSVSQLAGAVTRPERFCGMHYFYHAAKNRLVEIIPGEQTSRETLATAERFAFLTGKDPIVCRDRYGFAVNRFFVPWLNEACRILEEGTGSPGQIDAVCRESFGIGMGPFALMNATGVPIAYHAQRTLESFGTLYAVSNALEQQARKNEPWDIDEAEPGEHTRMIRDRMLGVVFLVCGQILDEEVCTPTDLNRGARIGLKWHRGPIELMRALGAHEVERLVRMVATRYQTAFPRNLGRAHEPAELVHLSRAGRTSIIRMNRPEDLNALNEQVIEQLASQFRRAQDDPETDMIVLTGSGKAFVAGADISFLVDNLRGGAVDRIISFIARTHEVFAAIEGSHKRVIAVLNGMALGGGLELALCADTILALHDATLAFPETGLGIYPGLGGTQRTQDRIGRGLTKYLIYTGEMVPARGAREMGLVDELISPDDYFAILDGAPVDRIHPDGLPPRDDRWEAINDFFESYPLEHLLGETPCDGGLPAADIERWRKRVRQKAPIALQAAQRLVDEARGTASELELLPIVFNSNDAMLGLSSVGKKVVFAGN